ncbi:FAD binding domain-containing protein [Blastococcus sp. SYSU D00820]
MKPAPFTYSRAESLESAVSLLGEDGAEARVLAGGQSLVAQMNLRDVRPGRLVDIMRARDLQGIDASDGFVEIQAAVRQARVEDDPRMGERVPLLAEALAKVAYREIRNAGTVCGSIAHADPLGEVPTVAVTLDAEIVAHGPRGRRSIPATDFFRARHVTALQPDELLAAVRFPAATPGTGSAFVEMAPRKGGYAIVGAAATLRIEDGVIAGAAVGLLGVADTPVRSRRAEAVLRGGAPSEALFREAAAAAAGDVDPADDVHATAAHRTHLTSVLTRRALTVAAARIQEKA